MRPTAFQLALSVLAAGLFGLGGAGVPVHAQSCDAGPIPAGPLRYEVVASAPRLNRELLGPALSSVQGVQAEPVDSFVYDGVGSIPVEGFLKLVVDPVAEVGVIIASWTDPNGEWTYTQGQFIHPEHWSGVRVGSSIATLEFFINEGITSNVYIHGDTDAGMPVLPTLHAYLATWGPAAVTLDGQPFENPYEIPAPLWLGHAMVTEGVRHPDGSVRTVAGEIYDPSMKSEGGVESGDLEVHLVFHDERFPMTSNFPPIFQFFYHLVFEDVSIEIVENDAPIVDPACPPEPEFKHATPRPQRPTRRD